VTADHPETLEGQGADHVTPTTDHAGATRRAGVDAPAVDALPSDWRIAGAVWPTLVASVLGLLPFTVYSTFLVPIADAVGDSDAAVGALRGLGGIGAVLVGVAVAPLIGPIPPGRLTAWALVLLAAMALVGTVSWLPALAVFCLLIGVSNAVLYPALGTAAADRFGTGPASVRAATLVTATKTLAATLVAPLVAFPALLWGWRGDLVAIAVVAIVLTPILLRYGRGRQVLDDAAPRHGYFAAFRALAAVPGARALLLVSFGQAGAFQGYLAYLALFYTDRFGLSPSTFAFVWTLSGGSFFLGNLVAGRMVNATESDQRACRSLHVFLPIALVSLFGVFLAPVLPVALIATAVLSASHAVGVAAVATLLVRRSGTVRGTALSLNATGLSLGLFVGAAAGGVGLAVTGYLGAASVFGVFTVLSIGAALTLRHRDP